MIRRLPIIVVLLAHALVAARPAAASTRLAVFITADDAQLSYNLTEVAIASLAGKRAYELLGLRELESRLNELPAVKSDGLRACLAAPACLAEVGTTAGVEQAVVGDVRREADHYRLDLALVDTTTGAPRARRSPEFPRELDGLIAAVQAGVLEIVTNPGVQAAVPPPIAPVVSPPPRKRTDPPPAPKRDRKSDRGSIVPYVAYGTAGLAIVAFSAAVVTGTLARARPEGATRAEVQEDVERRKGYATASNTLLVSGFVLAGTAVVTFAVSW